MTILDDIKAQLAALPDNSAHLFSGAFTYTEEELAKLLAMVEGTNAHVVTMGANATPATGITPAPEPAPLTVSDELANEATPPAPPPVEPPPPPPPPGPAVGMVPPPGEPMNEGPMPEPAPSPSEAGSDTSSEPADGYEGSPDTQSEADALNQAELDELNKG
jgi:hypothetical protein